MVVPYRRFRKTYESYLETTVGNYHFDAAYNSRRAQISWWKREFLKGKENRKLNFTLYQVAMAQWGRVRCIALLVL
jgi:hypothetical protein